MNILIILTENIKLVVDNTAPLDVKVLAVDGELLGFSSVAWAQHY